MKQLIISTLVILSTLSSAHAIPKKESSKVFKISKSNVSERMYQYFYCLTISGNPKDVAKATANCNYVLDKRNSIDAQGLGDQITANLSDFSKDVGEMMSCLRKEGDNSSTVNDQTALSICENLVMPTRGLEL